MLSGGDGGVGGGCFSWMRTGSRQPEAPDHLHDIGCRPRLFVGRLLYNAIAIGRDHPP